MLTELQQRRVWEGLLAAEIRANYFADLSNLYHRRQRLATWVTLFFSSGAFATFVFKDLPAEYAWVRPVLALLTAAITAYSLVVQNQKSAIDSSDLHMRWNRLASSYEALWDDMYDDGAQVRLRALEQEGSELSKSGTAFPNDTKRMLRWQEHVEKHHAAHVSA